jgi:hypothetical protein
MKTDLEVACPVYRDGVFSLKYVDEVAGMFLPNVFDVKIVDH